MNWKITNWLLLNIAVGNMQGVTCFLCRQVSFKLEKWLYAMSDCFLFILQCCEAFLYGNPSNWNSA